MQKKKTQIEYSTAGGILSHPAAAYIAPFAAFAVITYVAALFGEHHILFYPLKIVVLAAVLLAYRDAYRGDIRVKFDWLGLLSGVVVFLIWIGIDGLFPHIGSSQFNPWSAPSVFGAYLVFFFKFAGASLGVPVMEELFWRSFAMRFLISNDFKSVPLGRFSWFSLIVVSLAFGFEHHRWLSGILAGLVYAAVLYRSGNLFVPILSHATTNFLICVYVAVTGSYELW